MILPTFGPPRLTNNFNQHVTLLRIFIFTKSINDTRSLQIDFIGFHLPPDRSKKPFEQPTGQVVHFQLDFNQRS